MRIHVGRTQLGVWVPMAERPFLDKERKPDTAALEASLGPAFVFYCDLTDLCDGLEREWVHTNGSGWMLKIADRKKALCYLIPLEDSFSVSMAIRESEQSALLESEDMADYRALLASARKFTEGYSIVFDVSTHSSYDKCRHFVSRIIEARR